VSHWKQWAQARPADTNNATLYAAIRGWAYRVYVIVCNNTGGALTFRVFHDQDGTTYSEATALAYDEALAANARVRVPSDGWIYMDEDGDDNIGVRSSSANGLSFTLYGERQKEEPRV